MKPHGLNVADVTYKEPGNSLPKWVRKLATSRGYGDATEPLSLYITEDDIAEAFTCAAQGDGSNCVMAQAGTRIGAKSVYFYRTTAWIDFGEGPIVRFRTSRQIYANVIRPFDRGTRDEVIPGIYHLTPPEPSRALSTRRAYDAARGGNRDGNHTGQNAPVAHAHTERVVMAARAGAA